MAVILIAIIFIWKKNTVTLEEKSAKIALSDSGTTYEGAGVTVDEDKVTITNPGEYEVSGALSDGRLIIDVPSGTVHVTLAGVSITSEDKDAIYSKDAADVNITVADGTENTLISGTEGFEIEESELDDDGSIKNKQKSAIYVKGNLAITGEGTLGVTGYINNGIQAKGTLSVADANITIDAQNHGMKSGDEMTLLSGTYNIVSVEDAFQSDLNITISDGTYQIEAGDDGIHADGELTIDNGTITIAKSNEGLEGHIVTINDGTIDITSSDDGINANDGSSTGFGMGGGMNKQDFSGEAPEGMAGDGTAPTAPEGMAGDGTAPTAPEGMAGDGTAPTAPEGMPEDGTMPTAPEGMPEDGTMPTPPDGTDTESMEAPSMENAQNPDSTQEPSQDEENTEEESEVDTTTIPELTINGGTIHVNAEGDGLDSNGNMTINGGEVYVDGPSNGGNSALDYGSENSGILTINGGTVVAIGMSDMLEAVDSTSTQESVMFVFSSTVNQGTEVKVADSNGNEIISFTPAKNADSVILSTPDMEQGVTYTFSYGGTSEEITATEINATNYTGKGMGGGMQDGERPNRGDFQNGANSGNVENKKDNMNQDSDQDSQSEDTDKDDSI